MRRTGFVKAAAVIIAVAVISAGCGGKSTSVATAPDQAADKASDIVILFTNDVHCGVDDHIGYAGLSSYKKQMIKEGNDVVLVDDGDSVQGGFIGMLTIKPDGSMNTVLVSDVTEKDGNITAAIEKETAAFADTVNRPVSNCDFDLVDIDVLEKYISSFENGIPEEYKDSQERIHYVE